MSVLKSLWDTAVTEVSRVNEQLSDQIFNAPEAEVMVRKATNNELWGPSGTDMSKIADLTHHFTEYRQVMDALWTRLTEKTEGRNWRNLYKSLLLLEYLLKNGSDKVIVEARQRLFDIKALQRFQYIDDKDQDHGLSVRERSKLICELLQDTDRLKDERKNAARSRAKYQESISSQGGRVTHQGRPGQYGPRGMEDLDISTRGSRGKSNFDFDSEEENNKVPAKEDWDPFPGRRGEQQQKQNTKSKTPDFDEDEDWGESAFAKKTAQQSQQPQKQTQSQQPQTQSNVFNPFDDVVKGSLLGTPSTTSPSNNANLLGNPNTNNNSFGLLQPTSGNTSSTSFANAYGPSSTTSSMQPTLLTPSTTNYSNIPLGFGMQPTTTTQPLGYGQTMNYNNQPNGFGVPSNNNNNYYYNNNNNTTMNF